MGPCCCAASSLVAVSGGRSLAAALGFLTVAASRGAQALGPPEQT